MFTICERSSPGPCRGYRRAQYLGTTRSPLWLTPGAKAYRFAWLFPRVYKLELPVLKYQRQLASSNGNAIAGHRLYVGHSLSEPTSKKALRYESLSYFAMKYLPSNNLSAGVLSSPPNIGMRSAIPERWIPTWVYSIRADMAFHNPSWAFFHQEAFVRLQLTTQFVSIAFLTQSTCSLSTLG